MFPFNVVFQDQPSAVQGNKLEYAQKKKKRKKRQSSKQHKKAFMCALIMVKHSLVCRAHRAPPALQGDREN